MKQIINIDNDTRMLIEVENYTLQFRRKSKKLISWRVDSYHTNLTSLSLAYLNSAPQRANNAIKSLDDIVVAIREAEARICKLIIKHNKKL